MASTIDIRPGTDDDATSPGASTPGRSAPRLRKRGRVSFWFAVVWLAVLTFLTLFHGQLGFSNAEKGGNVFGGKQAPTLDVIPWLDGDGFRFREPLPKVVATDAAPGDQAAADSDKLKNALNDILGKTEATTTVPGAPPPAPERPAAHYFGTDRNGRDVLSRTIASARLSLGIGAGATILGMLGGGALGLLAGFHGRRIDAGLTWVSEVLLSIPALVLLIALSVTVFGTAGWRENPFKVIIPLSILAVPPLFRLVRAQTLVYSQREFVMASRSLGAKNGRIIVKEILPNVIPSMLSFSLTALGVLIVAEGALSIFGLSLPAAKPTWGNQMREGRELLQDAWWISIIPAIFLFITVLACNIVGDQLSQRFAQKETVG